MKAIEENTVKAAGQTNGFARISWIGDKGKRVLIFGNSITRHPPAPDCIIVSERVGKYVFVSFRRRILNVLFLNGKSCPNLPKRRSLVLILS